MSGLPTSWADIELSVVAQVTSGIGFPNEYQGHTSGDLPFFKVSDISHAVLANRGELKTANHYVSHEVAEKLKGKPLAPGSTVFAKIGEAVRLNRRATVTTPCLIDNNVMAVKARDGVDDRYVHQFLRTIDFGESARSTTVPSLRKGDVEELRFPLAPAAEQKRIADKLDTVLTRVDAVNTRLARVAPLLKRFRQSVLAAATSGRLTEDWREIRETAPWTDKRIEDVAKVFLGRQRSPVNHEGPFMRRYVRAANVTWSGWDLSDVKEMNFDADDFERYRLQKNDILLNEGSGSADEVGKPAIWNEEIPDCCFQNTLICVRPETVDAKFMFLVLLHAALTKRFVDSTRGVNIHHIGKQNMARFPVAVPNADEQTEIVRRVETLFAFADRLEARLAQAQTAATRLTPALLAKAFRGELVPQDPNDEPAAELLRRLQAERATAPKASAGRGRKAAVRSEG